MVTTGGTVTNYSPRFTLTGMTGTFPPNIKTGISAITGTAGPATQNNAAQNNAAGAGAGAGVAAAGAFTVPYTLQTGLTRYAPMQNQPGSKITAKTVSPQWPTSGVTLATTLLPPPSVVTTVTQSGTWSVSSMENTVGSNAVFLRRLSTDMLLHRSLLLRNLQTICKSTSLGGGIEGQFLF